MNVSFSIGLGGAQVSLASAKPFAVFGDIPFTLPAYFDSFEQQSGQEFAEHALIEGKPRLQRIGAQLERIDIEVGLHHSFCSVATEIARLRELLASGQARALVFASGEYKGHFVLADLRQSLLKTMADGTPLAARLQLSLREFAAQAGQVDGQGLEQTQDKKPATAQMQATRTGGQAAPAKARRRQAPQRPADLTCTRRRYQTPGGDPA